MAFTLPITDFLVTKLKENFPEFDLREGTAYRDMLVKPQSLLFQPLRDTTNVIRRNLSLGNFALMLEDEFDELVSNIFVTRRDGDSARGTVRVFFESPRDTVIGTDVIFLSENGDSFNPESPIIITAEQMKLNTEGLFFFVDVAVISSEPGEEFNVEAGAIIFVEGGPEGITSVNNSSALTDGVDQETNTVLFARAQTAISVRNLVTDRSIPTVLLEQFTQVREMLVVGQGEAEMLRDITPILIDLGEVIGTQTTGSTAVSTTFTDVTEDFVAALVAPGHELIIQSGADAGTHVITSVTTTTLEVSVAFTAAASGLSYRIRGFAIKEDVHIGGKVDIYSDTTSVVSKEIVIEPIPTSTFVKVNRIASDGSVLVGDDKFSTIDFDFIDEEVTTSDQLEIVSGPNVGTFDILSIDNRTQVTLDTTGFLQTDLTAKYRILRDYYDAGTLFDKPVLNAIRVVRLDPITREELGADLVEGSQFFIRSNDSGTRFSTIENIEFEFDSTFIGTTMKIEYNSDPTIGSIQTFVDDSDQRVVTADLLSKHSLPAFVDMDIEFKGSLDTVDLIPLVEDFIDTIPFQQTLQASDVIAFLYAFNVNFVMLSITMTVELSDVDGTITTTVDPNEIEIPRNAHFIARTITMTKAGN